MLSIFSCAFWQSVYLQGNVSFFRSSANFLIGWFLGGFVLFCLIYWAAWAFCKFYRLIPCHSHHLQIFSHILCVGSHKENETTWSLTLELRVLFAHLGRHKLCKAAPRVCVLQHAVGLGMAKGSCYYVISWIWLKVISIYHPGLPPGSYKPSIDSRVPSKSYIKKAFVSVIFV